MEDENNNVSDVVMTEQEAEEAGAHTFTNLNVKSFNPFDDESIEHIFSYHPPTEEQQGTYRRINEAFIACAKKIIPLLPDGPGKNAAVRALADARMKANAAVALEGRF